MNQKSSLIQTLKFAPKVLTSDNPFCQDRCAFFTRMARRGDILEYNAVIIMNPISPEIIKFAEDALFTLF